MGGFDAGEALVEATEGEGEAVVIEAELVEDGGVEIPDVVGVPGDVPGEVIGFTEYRARFDTRAGEPDGEAAAVVIPAGDGGVGAALGVDGAAELAAPDDEGVFEQAALFEIEDKGRGRLVGIAALVG